VKSRGRLGLVRHGQTHANIERVWHGQTDTALTDLGQRQARRLGEHFHHYMEPEVIYASPLQRARLTAQAIGDRFGIPVKLDPRLMELHLGDWEGATFDSLQGSSDVMRRLVQEPDFAAPRGESQNLVKRRMVEAIEEIAGNHPQENIVIVAHGVSIGIALAQLVEGDSTRWPKYQKGNTAFSELCLETNRLLSYNRLDHLVDDER